MPARGVVCLGARAQGPILIGALLLAALPSVADVVRVSGVRGVAHACPVEGGLLLTNAHVVDAMPILRWSDGADDGGNEGTAEVLRRIPGADLAVLKVTRGKPAHEFSIAKEAPHAGDRVVTRGYRRNSRREMFTERRVETRVGRIIAGLLIYEDDAFAGSSGACVFNEKGEVVAINAAGAPTESNDQSAGIAVGLWGEWSKEIETGPEDGQ